MPAGHKRAGCCAGETARTEGDRASRQWVQRERDQRQRVQRGNFAEERRAGQQRKERLSRQDGVTGQGRHTGEERRAHRAGEQRHHTSEERRAREERGGEQFELNRLFSENRAGLGSHRADAFQTGGARRLLQSMTDLVALLMNRGNHRSRGQAKTDQRGLR